MTNFLHINFRGVFGILKLFKTKKYYLFNHNDKTKYKIFPKTFTLLKLHFEKLTSKIWIICYDTLSR